MKPKPEKKIVGNSKIPEAFDIRAHWTQNADQIYAKALLETVWGLNLDDTAALNEVNNYLIAKPISLSVLLLVMGDLIETDDMVKSIIISNRNSLNSKKDRINKPTKAQLLNFRDEIVRKNAENDLNTDRGWKKAAQKNFEISDKTLKKILGKQ